MLLSEGDCPCCDVLETQGPSAETFLCSEIGKKNKPLAKFGEPIVYASALFTVLLKM